MGVNERVTSHPFSFVVHSIRNLKKIIHPSSKTLFRSHSGPSVVAALFVLLLCDGFILSCYKRLDGPRMMMLRMNSTLSCLVVSFSFEQYNDRNIFIVFPNHVVKPITLKDGMIPVLFRHVSSKQLEAPMNIGNFISIRRIRMQLPQSVQRNQNDWPISDCMKIVLPWVHPYDPIRTLVHNGRNGTGVRFIRIPKHVIDVVYYLSLTQWVWDGERR